MNSSPVVPENGDGGAAEADVDENAAEVEAEDGGDQRGRAVAGGHDARAALVDGRGRDRGRGRTVGHGGSKGLGDN